MLLNFGGMGVLFDKEYMAKILYDTETTSQEWFL